MSQLASPVEIYWISGSPFAWPAPGDWGKNRRMMERGRLPALSKHIVTVDI